MTAPCTCVLHRSAEERDAWSRARRVAQDVLRRMEDDRG